MLFINGLNFLDNILFLYNSVTKKTLKNCSSQSWVFSTVEITHPSTKIHATCSFKTTDHTVTGYMLKSYNIIKFFLIIFCATICKIYVYGCHWVTLQTDEEKLLVSSSFEKCSQLFDSIIFPQVLIIHIFYQKMNHVPSI